MMDSILTVWIVWRDAGSLSSIYVIAPGNAVEEKIGLETTALQINWHLIIKVTDWSLGNKYIIALINIVAFVNG